MICFNDFQVPGTEGRAGMAAILDKDATLNLSKFAEGVKKVLPSYARPQFLRILRQLEMTGKLTDTDTSWCLLSAIIL